MKIRCEYKKLVPTDFGNKSFANFKKFFRSRKVRERVFAEKNHRREVVHFGSVLFAFESSQHNVFASELYLSHPAIVIGPLAGSFKSGRLGSSAISAIISMIAKAKIFFSIVKRVTVDVIHNKPWLSIHNVAVQVEFALRANVFAGVVLIMNPLRVPPQIPVALKAIVGFAVNFCFLSLRNRKVYVF